MGNTEKSTAWLRIANAVSGMKKSCFDNFWLLWGSKCQEKQMNASKFCILNFQKMFVKILLDKLAHTKKWFLQLEKYRDKDWLCIKLFLNWKEIRQIYRRTKRIFLKQRQYNSLSQLIHSIVFITISIIFSCIYYVVV